MNATYVFKLKNDIRHEEEVALAELELRSLMKNAELEPAANLADVLYSEPLRELTMRADHLVQDVFLRLPFPGRIQAFIYAGPLRDISKLVASLAYFKEIFVATSEESALGRLLPSGNLGCPNYTYPTDMGTIFLHRIITVSALLDYSNHIVKKWEIPEFAEQFNKLLMHLETGQHNIPVLTLGREIEDFADMGGPVGDKYLFHGIHTFPGSQFPRMIRALVNVLELQEDDVFLDPHNGGGTMCIEACLLSHRSEGWDTIPLFNLITESKMSALKLSWDDFNAEVSRLLLKIKSDFKKNFAKAQNDQQLTAFTSQSSRQAPRSLIKLPRSYQDTLTTKQLAETSTIVHALGEVQNGDVRKLCQVALSNLLFDIYYRQHSTVVRRRFIKELVNLSKRLYLWDKILKPRLSLKIADCQVRMCDSRDTGENTQTFGGIITSPPYIEAEAYGDLGSLSSICLGIGTESEITGWKNLSIGREAGRDVTVTQKEVMESDLPDIARKTVLDILGTPQIKAKATTAYVYYRDMQRVLRNLTGLLKDGGRCILVVAEPHFWKTDGDFFFVPNSEILKQLAEKSGLGLEFDLLVPLAKAFKRHKITNGERLMILRKGPTKEIKLSVKALKGLHKLVEPPDVNWKCSLQAERASYPSTSIT